MMTVKIPGQPRPFTVQVNGRKYILAPGEQIVPDEVGEVVLRALKKDTEPAAKEPFEGDNVNRGELKDYAKPGDVMPKAESIEGYDAEKAQTLTHDDSGALSWVDNE